MTYFPPENEPFPIPSERASIELYNDAHANFAIGYTDLVPRNPETGELFLAERAIEPHKGHRWFIGGRITAGKSNDKNAAEHFERDTGIRVEPGRFREVSHWTIAHVTRSTKEDEQPQVRHCQNTVLVVDLTPEEIAKLNKKVTEGELSYEYAGGSGEWFNPETGDTDRLLPPVKQFLRDLFTYEVTMEALHSTAKKEMEQHFSHKS